MVYPVTNEPIRGGVKFFDTVGRRSHLASSAVRLRRQLQPQLPRSRLGTPADPSDHFTCPDMKQRGWFNLSMTEQVTGAHSLIASVYINGALKNTFNENFGINSFAGITTYLGGQYLGTTQ